MDGYTTHEIAYVIRIIAARKGKSPGQLVDEKVKSKYATVDGIAA